MCPPKSSFVLPLLISIALLSSPLIFGDTCSKDDKKVLEVLKDELYLTGWPPLDEVACCDLEGIECDINTGRVIGIDINESFRNITIPHILVNLPFLRNLRFHKNPGLTGPIPSFLGTIKTLAFIDFSWNSFTGPVPEFFGHLNKLTYLDLSFNQLTGMIPSSLSLPTAIYAIDISRNHLTGTIPESFGATNMSYLILSHNNLTGVIPKSFAGNQVLTLDLSRNQLSGDASFLFGATKQLEVLDLSRNQFEFNVSEVVFPQSMISIDVNHNKIFGTLPPEIATVKWQHLNVSYNRLCGRIPRGNWSQEFDEYSFFHNKCLCGAPLPAC